MKFLGLSIQGLRSYVGDHVFHFPVGKGTYFVTGDNRKYPRLRANGTGKSAIWDVLCWVFYGKSTRGQIAGDMANWTREYVSIGALDFEIRGINYSITRTFDPNSLTLQVGNAKPKTVEQVTIDSLIGFSYELFLATVVMSQFGTSFLELGPAKKLEWVSTVLGLDVWTDRSDAAKANAKAYKGKRDGCRDEVTRFDSELESLRRNYELERRRDDAWAETNAQSLASARGAHDRATQAYDQAKAVLAGLHTRKLEEIDCVRELEQQQSEVERRVEEYARVLRRTHTDLENLDHDQDDLEGTKRILEGCGGECPTCTQGLQSKTLERVLAGLDEQIEALEHKRGPIRADVARYNDAIRQDNATRDEYSAGLRARRDGLELLGRDISAADRRSVGAGRDLTAAADRANAAGETVSPHTGALEQLLKDIKLADLDRTTAECERVLHEGDRLEAIQLSDYFKDARLWVCEGAMGEFAAVMSGALEQLGLVGWDVLCDLEKPNKKGKGTQRGFQVLIRSPDAPDWVPWESWCGGETQRLVNAGSVAFADLACSRMGISPSMEVWDEQTQHLSPEGVSDLLAYLHARARRLDRQIFLVDHRSVGAGEFAGSYVVIMDNNGSRIESDQTRRNERCDQVLSKASGRRRFSELQATGTT